METGNTRAIPAAWWLALAVGVLLLPGAMLMDRELAAAIRPTESAWLIPLAQWGTWLGYGLVDIAVPLLIGLTGRWRYGDDEAWRRGLLGGIAVALAGLANTFAKNVLCRARRARRMPVPSLSGFRAFRHPTPRLHSRRATRPRRLRWRPCSRCGIRKRRRPGSRWPPSWGGPGSAWVRISRPTSSLGRAGKRGGSGARPPPAAAGQGRQA